MRFRNLSQKELESLSDEFIQFLVIQGIDDDLWRDINKEKPDQAIALVSLFSDTVLEKVYSKVNFLSFVSEQVFSIFKIERETMHAVVVKNKSSRDPFKNLEHVLQSMESKTIEHEVFTASRVLGNKILDEIHELTEKGCLVADEGLWKRFARYSKKK